MFLVLWWLKMWLLLYAFRLCLLMCFGFKYVTLCVGHPVWVTLCGSPSVGQILWVTLCGSHFAVSTVSIMWCVKCVNFVKGSKGSNCTCHMYHITHGCATRKKTNRQKFADLFNNTLKFPRECQRSFFHKGALKGAPLARAPLKKVRSKVAAPEGTLVRSAFKRVVQH